jgi:xylitol oxidase
LFRIARADHGWEDREVSISSVAGDNWAGSHTFGAPRLVEAASIDEVRETVRRAAAEGARVRALGTRHSFTDLADTTGTLVSVTGVDPDAVLDEQARTVTVGGGVRYGVLARRLEDHGWALHNMGSLPHISVAGAVATGTHGSGIGNQVLSAAVAGLEYVDHHGELVSVRRGDPDFDALVVGLGAFGVVVRVTLDVQPSYEVRQDVYRDLPWDAVLGDLEAVMGFGYSVSIFDDWQGPSVDQLWVKSRLDRPLGGQAGGEAGERMPDRWLGAERDPRSEGRLIDLASENLTVQGGVPGAWLDRLPHFRLETTPSVGDELQTEYFVERSDGPAALAAVRELRDRITPLLLVTELRTAASDELWLSPAYGRDVLAIHFTWKKLPDEVWALLPDIEAALAPFGAWPHWGKVHRFDAETLRRMHPRLDDARAVFDRLDPHGMFANEHLERVGVRTPRSPAG